MAEAPSYESIHRRISGQVQQLAASVEANLQPMRRLDDRRGFASGHRPDLRRVMRSEADERERDKVWLRKIVPTRWSVAFSLLVDLSGSMQGAKVDAATCGAVLLAETLHRLRVPFAVNGFQDTIIPFCRFDDAFADEVRIHLAEMPLEVAGQRPGGNNRPSWNDDGPCLLAAAEELLDLPYQEKMLIVVSDGLPEGSRSTADDLHKAVAELRATGAGLQLLGIGLGPGTDHVRQFYPTCVASVPVERLAEEIGQLLQQSLQSNP
jgi:cobalamin biosynthesis protein CobT